MLTPDDLVKKWEAILEHKKFPAITDNRKRLVTAAILENTQRELESVRSPSMSIFEAAAPTTNTTNVQNYDPVLISLIRRSVPNLIAFDVVGVQPMSGPTGLVFALRPQYVDSTNNEIRTEAWFTEPDTDFSGTGTHSGELGDGGTVTTGSGLATADGEALGVVGNFNEMSFEIESVSVTAKTRALKAEFSTELAQDLKAIHGLDAETEISNMLATELIGEINREIIRTVFVTAKNGAVNTSVPGTFNLDVDSDGRWQNERFKSLMFHIEREANRVGVETRRGKGNLIICSPNVASALQMSGLLDNAPALAQNNLNVDPAGNTFAGVLNNRYRVHIDPYAGGEYLIVGYKGVDSFDAGIFYAPYTPLQMVTARGENTFQPKIGFKTRFGLVANPFAQGSVKGGGALNANSNVYYRKTLVANLA